MRPLILSLLFLTSCAHVPPQKPLTDTFEVRCKEVNYLDTTYKMWLCEKMPRENLTAE